MSLASSVRAHPGFDYRLKNKVCHIEDTPTVSPAQGTLLQPWACEYDKRACCGRCARSWSPQSAVTL